MDYSFLKLHPTLAEAKTDANPRVARSVYTGFVGMLPNETILQTTNYFGGLNWDDTTDFAIVDACGVLVRQLSQNADFFFQTFTDPVTGWPQAVFEFGNFGVDFGDMPLFLRSTIDGTDSQYSAPFLCTASLAEESTSVLYKSKNRFNGVDYQLVDYFQKIRLWAFYSDVDPSTEADELMRLSGEKAYLRNITTPVTKFQMYACDTFTYLRMVGMLNNSIVYLDGQRYSTSGKNAQKDERTVDSNIFAASFTANVLFGDIIDPNTFQLYRPLGRIQLLPAQNAHTNTTLWFPELSITFNRPMFPTAQTGVVFELYKLGVLTRTYDQTEVWQPASNKVAATSFAPTGAAVEHTVVFYGGFFVDALGQTLEVPYGVWQFYVDDNKFDPAYFNSNKFL